LDQLIELMIKAFDALKRIKELEDEAEKNYRSEHDALVKQIELLEEREKKRKEQESRWLHAQIRVSSPTVSSGQFHCFGATPSFSSGRREPTT